MTGIGNDDGKALLLVEALVVEERANFEEAGVTGASLPINT